MFALFRFHQPAVPFGWSFYKIRRNRGILKKSIILLKIPFFILNFVYIDWMPAVRYMYRQLYQKWQPLKNHHWDYEVRNTHKWKKIELNPGFKKKSNYIFFSTIVSQDTEGLFKDDPYMRVRTLYLLSRKYILLLFLYSFF